MPLTKSKKKTKSDKIESKDLKAKSGNKVVNLNNESTKLDISNSSAKGGNKSVNLGKGSGKLLNLSTSSNKVVDLNNESTKLGALNLRTEDKKKLNISKTGSKVAVEDVSKNKNLSETKSRTLDASDDNIGLNGEFSKSVDDYSDNNGDTDYSKKKLDLDSSDINFNQTGEGFSKTSDKPTKMDKLRKYIKDLYTSPEFSNSRYRAKKMRSKTITFGNNLSRYLSEINKQETLSDDEEIELSKLIKKGDKDAFHKLIKGNLRFVVSIAKQYNNRGLSFDELVSEGNIGLIKGVQRYDESQGVKFISYAVWWIRQAISTSLSEGGRIIKLPVNKIGQLNRYVVERNKLIQKFRREPTLDELSESLNVSEKELNSIISNYGFPVNADSAPRDDDNFSFISILADENDTNLTDKRDAIAFNDDLSKILSKLSSVEREVIRCFFGTSPYQAPKTLDEIGDMLNLTRERVRQIKEKAISNIRKFKLEDKLRPYINKNFGSV